MTKRSISKISILTGAKKTKQRQVASSSPVTDRIGIVSGEFSSQSKLLQPRFEKRVERA